MVKGSNHRSEHRSPDQDASSVDVQQAEETFNELSRQLSARSQTAIPDTKNPSPTSTVAGHDVEKAEHSQEPFDLREYLTSSNDANQQAGIKHKHVGVTWEDLEVKVMGGVDHKVCS